MVIARMLQILAILVFLLRGLGNNSTAKCRLIELLNKKPDAIGLEKPEILKPENPVSKFFDCPLEEVKE